MMMQDVHIRSRMSEILDGCSDPTAKDVRFLLDVFRMSRFSELTQQACQEAHVSRVELALQDSDSILSVARRLLPMMYQSCGGGV
jgi:hypothetical protein